MNLPRRFHLPLLCSFGLLLAGCQKKLDPANAAQLFFEQVGHGKAGEAFANSAFAFQAQQDLRLFVQTARELGLTDFVSATWQTPIIQERSAQVRGEIVTKSGGKLELLVLLNEESGAWRVYSVKKPREVQTGLGANLFGSLGKSANFRSPVDRPLPGPEEIQRLALESLLLLDEGVREKSFAKFYNQVSRSWQNQLTVGQLERAFKPMMDQKADMSDLRSSKAVFDPEPFINTAGALVVDGSYPTKPYEVVFSLKFSYELLKWKLIGVTVSFRKSSAESSAMPPESKATPLEESSSR